MKKIISTGAILIMTACVSQPFQAVVDMPYTDANTTRPSVELTQVERTDSTTELTFMASYDYHYATFQFGDKINLVAGDTRLPVKSIESLGNTLIKNDDYVVMPQGIPVQFKLVFAALPKDVETVDFVQEKDGAVINSIWGIDLTSRRSPESLPADIPENLLTPAPFTGTLPHIVETDGIAKITVHMVAWRSWMDHRLDLYINTLDATQEKIKAKFDDGGVVTVEVPLKGTALISAHTPYNVSAGVYVDPGEDINLYVLPTNSSDAQRFIRPQGVSDGKYRHFEAISDELSKVFEFDDYMDTLLINKTNPDEYFAAMMKIHSNGLDTIKAHNLDYEMERFARSYVDRRMMYQAVNPGAYIPRDWNTRDSSEPDSVLRFSSDQVRQLRTSIDFDNPLLELKSISDVRLRSRFLKAKELILAE